MNVFDRAAFARPLAALAIAVAAGGCAHPDALRVGMSRDELDRRMGTPAAVRHDPSGEVRIYSTSPFGQVASAAHLDASGRVVEVEPLMNLEHFAKVRIGEWNENDVLTHLGRPSLVRRTREYLVWSYRWRESYDWSSLFHVMFDDQGIVRRTETGPDDEFDPREHGFP